ncbi:MAG: hypothetical protein ABI603_11765, partial [Acidobacteriota bacterium]
MGRWTPRGAVAVAVLAAACWIAGTAAGTQADAAASAAARPPGHQAGPGGLRAATAKVDITPEAPQWLLGYQA